MRKMIIEVSHELGRDLCPQEILNILKNALDDSNSYHREGVSRIPDGGQSQKECDEITRNNTKVKKGINCNQLSL